jgi:hypothetical protein
MFLTVFNTQHNRSALDYARANGRSAAIVDLLTDGRGW